MALFLREGEIFSGCEIISRCGEGSFGVTYLAKNPIGQRIAIKIVSSPLSREQEIKGIRHYMKAAEDTSCLLKIYHVGEMESGFYYTMEAADDCGDNGVYRPATLHNLFKNTARFTPERAVKVIRELLVGLQALHEARLIHRDIKPDNIVFVNSKAKLSDPGLVTEVGKTVTLAGTIGFIPPEIASGDAVADQTSDLYALGKVFYCMVTGYKPQQYPALPPDMRLEVCRQLYPVLSRVCNRNPEKRFKSAEEFLAGLPEVIGEPTKWERIRENFRDWKTCNRELWRALLLILAVLILFCSAGLGTAVWQYRRNVRLGELYRSNCEEFSAYLKEKGDLLLLQLESSAPEKVKEYNCLKHQFRDLCRKKRWSQAAEKLGAMRRFLSNCAAQISPALPAGTPDFAASFKAAGAMHGFKASPLFRYLEKSRSDAFKKQLEAFEKELYTNWQGPRCDRPWISMQHYHMPMSFIPPGAFRDSRSGKIVKMPYHFWMCQLEVGEAPLNSYLGINPKKSTFSNTPMERLSWNDMLLYCLKVTEILEGMECLPPGYIVRPPTEAEWLYAAGNAMLGKDKTTVEQRGFFRENSGSVPHPSGSRQPNRLGLFDMYGNVAEAVVPFDTKEVTDLLVVRGGSYLNGKKYAVSQRTYHPKYQTIPFDIGFRLVITPGDKSYFDENFYLFSKNQFRSRGKIYELIGANCGIFNPSRAAKTAALLGGKLAEFEDEAHVKEAMKAFPVLQSWLAAIGGKYVNGKWLWNSGREINFGTWKKSRSSTGSTAIALQKGKWVAVRDNYKLPVIICQWSEKEFQERNKNRLNCGKLPLELTRFTIGRKLYILFDAGISFGTAVRCCELMNGKLACPDDPEVMKKVIANLQPFERRHVLLGGYAKVDKWFWLSGKEFKEKLLKNPGDQIPRRNLNFITLSHGKLHDSQLCNSFLCEWDI